MKNNKARLIAFYLPQYHPIPENNQWWGKGFTEWVNVANAKSLFKGHEQPKIPADLGFYDLRLSEVREAQANMAREHGIEGFCYWHYWFGNGKRLLERPFSEVLESGNPDFPFCLAWANHSWYAKTWDPRTPDKLLIEQNYLGKSDYEQHFNEMLPAFRDNRYIKVKEKLFFLIFAPLASPEIKTFIEVWRNLAKKNNLNDFYFVGQGFRYQKLDIMKCGFDAFFDAALFSVYKDEKRFNKLLKQFKIFVFRKPAKIYDYSKTMKAVENNYIPQVDEIPCIYPNWDHSPRSREQGLILINVTPEAFREHVKSTMKCIQSKPRENRIIMIKSWNEWGEGNYLEPDIKHGMSFLKVLKDEIEKNG